MKGKEQKDRKKLLIAGGIILVLIVAAVTVFAIKKGMLKEKEGTPDNLEDYMTINLFPGFDGEESQKVLEGDLSNSEILLEYAGSYDGIFYEDGKNKKKKDVFSLILTNVSDRTLEVMQLWIEDEDGESYQFQVSALPTGGTVLAQELSGKTFKKNASYHIVRDTFGFMDVNMGAELSALQVKESEDGILVTNNSRTPFEAVQIIYKNWDGGHAYFGGIAYQIPLEGIEAGETLKITADHYKNGKSEVTGMKKGGTQTDAAEKGTGGAEPGTEPGTEPQTGE